MKDDGRLERLIRFVNRYYSWIALSFGAFLIFLETVEHVQHINHDERGSIAFWLTLLLIAASLFFNGILNRRLARYLHERNQAVDMLKLKNELGTLLYSCQDRYQVAHRLLQKTETFLSLAGIEVFFFDENSSWFLLSSQKNAAEREGLAQGLDPILCRECQLRGLNRPASIEHCDQVQCLPEFQRKDGYCIPVQSGENLIGLVFLYSQPEKKFTQANLELIENISNEITNAFLFASDKKAHEEKITAEQIRSVQLDIARDLHDTIGQNISYLRIKLDQLIRSHPNQDQKAIGEIQQMNHVANESYDFIRGTLAVLQTGNSFEMMVLFRRFVDQLAERGSFQINYSTHGQPVNLPAGTMRQLFYVFREALSNIEKHAQATQVKIDIGWEEQCLALHINDNGRGFNLSPAGFDGHFGLHFMRERIENLGGTFSIGSREGAGTQISVHVPYTYTVHNN